MIRVGERERHSIVATTKRTRLLSQNLASFVQHFVPLISFSFLLPLETFRPDHLNLSLLLFSLPFSFDSFSRSHFPWFCCYWIILHGHLPLCSLSPFTQILLLPLPDSSILSLFHFVSLSCSFLCQLSSDARLFHEQKWASERLKERKRKKGIDWLVFRKEKKKNGRNEKRDEFSRWVRPEWVFYSSILRSETKFTSQLFSFFPVLSSSSSSRPSSSFCFFPSFLFCLSCYFTVSQSFRRQMEHWRKRGRKE